MQVSHLKIFAILPSLYKYWQGCLTQIFLTFVIFKGFYTFLLFFYRLVGSSQVALK